MSRLLLIVPSRKRPKACAELLEEFLKTSEDAEILFGLDDDDKSEFPTAVLEAAEINPRLRMGGTLNLLANKYAEKYEYIGFMGDDHRPRTQGWDRILCDAIGDKPGVAYGDDLLQGANLPTAVVLSSSIVQKIGYMVPPTLVHMYMDNFWRDFGDKLGNLQYRPDVIIEHLHYLAGKAINDLQYQEVNSSSVYENDRIAYGLYQAGQFDKDIKKVLL
ncbi:hypothetical protein UFOVP529_91 [uncultured Caudovirales phage]|uniref:Glyco_tranf_GTA_type domain containing protein n=1 Tax=uncultured Caudovirales phage TaxID=2100421 RepID=A0A6J5RKV4_9CAUD|nr:hypothetical protein UFOVP529_91 [uncultured Caudovirales phage]CAB4190028.1 hypothetical protein UFOVP1191_29 [uncultured Caudovirales phage]CAB4194378.1 hypothetical protein UFOVP1252_30 [uncultured Caudovirales phage]